MSDENLLKQNNQSKPQPTPTPPAPEPTPPAPPKPELAPEAITAEIEPKIISPLPAEPVVEPQKPTEPEKTEKATFQNIATTPEEPEPAPKEESQPQTDNEPKEVVPEPKKPTEPEETEKATFHNVAETSAESEPAPKAEAPTPAPQPIPTAPTPPPPAPSAPEIPFAIKFKNKLKDLLQIANQKRSQKAQENLKKIMAYAQGKQKITNDEVEKIIGVKDSQAANYLNLLVKQNKLIKFGKTTNIFYKPLNK